MQNFQKLPYFTQKTPEIPLHWYEVVIRTNSIGTSLTVNAPKDVIRHYDVAGSVNIVESHTASYHEYGKVPFVEIAKGRIALEAGAEVENLHFNAKTQEEFDDIIVAYDQSVTLPEFSRDEVSIQSTGTLVVELQDSTDIDNHDSDYVWLYKQGVISQIVVTEDKPADSSITEQKTVTINEQQVEVTVLKDAYKAGVTAEVAQTQKAAVEIANNYTGSHGSAQTIGGKEVTVAELDEKDDIKTEEGKTLEETVAEAVEEKGLDETAKQEQKQETVAKNCTHIQFNEETQRLYHNCPICGVEFGTEELPYQLHNAAEFEGFIKLYDWEGYPGYYQVYRENAEGYLKYLYVELANDIDCSTINWPTGYSQVYYLNFEGNNHKLCNINTTGYLFQTAKYYTCFYNVDFEDCNMKGFWNTNEYGAEVEDVNFKNCTFSESVFGNYLYYYAYFDGLEFNNCSMPYFIKYPFYQTDCADYMNMKFYNCTIDKYLFSYAYDTLINMKDCVLDGCVETAGNALISYGGYSAYSMPTGFVFDNVDIKNSEAYGGAYIYYGGSKDFPITFKDCNVTNTSVYGGQGMAVGGFVGNASTSTVSFDGCSFDGEIISASAEAAGFIGQACTTAGKISITNSYISEGTKIVNKGGAGVTAFAGNIDGNVNIHFNKDGNRFLGTLSSTAASKTSSNGFEGFNYVKYSTLATKDDFTFDATTGELKYIGDGTFDKITVREQVGIDNIGAGLGGYSWVFDLQDTENVAKNTSLGNYTIVKSFKQVVDKDYEGEIPFMTTDKSYLDEAKKVAGNGLYFSDGVLAIDSQIYNNGSQFIFGGLSDVDNLPATRTIRLEILLIVDGNIEGSVTLSYNVNLK